MKKLLIFLVLLAIGAGLGIAYWQTTGGPGVTFRTAAAERGHLASTIDATGTIEPEEVIDVGAQVAGQIKEFGSDPQDSSKPVDYCSPVDRGTVLARIDDAFYAAQVEQARADLGLAQANVRRDEAGVVQARVKLNQA